METNKFNQTIKNIFLEAILSSTCHGIGKIVKSPNLPLKIFWIISVIFSSGLFGYMMVDNIMSYLKYEVSTKTRIIIEYEPYFPTITICNMNFLTSKLASKLIESHIEEFQNFNPLHGDFKTKVVSEFKQKKNEEEIRKLGDLLKKIIFDCRFEFEKCDYTQFKYFYHPFYGNCYQFNPGNDSNGNKINLKKSTSSERTYSLKLTLNVSIEDGLKFMSPSLGAVLLIHNHTTYPTMVDEITVGPEIETNIGLSRTFYKSQPYPYSICDGNTNDKNSFDSEYFKLVHENTKEYTQTLCVYQCMQKNIINRCNCKLHFFPSFYSTNSCNISSACVWKVFQENLIPEECYEKCPLECEGMWFDKTISINKFSNPSFEESLQNYFLNESPSSNKSINSNDLAYVNIFFKSFNYVSITENPTLTLIGLFSNIGGIAGLFLGSSVLTFVELIEILIQILLIKKNNKING